MSSYIPIPDQDEIENPVKVVGCNPVTATGEELMAAYITVLGMRAFFFDRTLAAPEKPRLAVIAGLSSYPNKVHLAVFGEPEKDVKSGDMPTVWTEWDVECLWPADGKVTPKVGLTSWCVLIDDEGCREADTADTSV